ncbi:MAG: MBL fold metallo-hydrolase [Candidatus Thorarchaeota archaeon]
MNVERIPFDSIYLEIYKLSEGIYASIWNQKLGPSSNAGFFDLGNITVVFDTMMDPFSTKDMIAAAKSITGKEPFLLINSHAHMDHVFGNRLFPISMPILSSKGTLNRFHKELEEQFNNMKKNAPNQFKNTEELLQNEKDPKKTIELKNDLVTYREIQEPKFELRPPDLILQNRMKVKGTDRSVEIINVGNAHSYEDIIAYFPDDKICFMGDLLFTNLDPAWANGINGTPWAVDPQNFQDIMKTYYEKDLDVYVPGHGVLCSKKEVKATIDYLDKYFLNK